MTISQQEYYLISDVSRMLDVPPHRIVYPLITRQIPEPQRIGGRRLFSWGDIQVIAAQLGRTLPERGEGSTK